MTGPPSWHPEYQQPGWYPLQPLSLGQILGTATRLAGRHLALLAPLALVAGVLATGVELWLLSQAGMLEAVRDGSWAVIPAGAGPAELERILLDAMPILWAAVAAGLVTGTLGGVLAGMAAPLAARAATTRSAPDGEAFRRLSGRWGLLLVVALISQLAVLGGTLLFVVPGLLAMVVLAVTGPVAAMEGGTVGTVLRRSAVLTRGSRWRVLGILLLSGLIAAVAAMVATSVIAALLSTSSTTAGYLVVQGVSVVVGALTGSWVACVSAMLYVDLRLRREGLADALRRSL